MRLHVGCLRLEIESSYLSELNSKEISERLEKKIQSKKNLTEEEMMEFIILPLTYKGLEEKNESIKKSIQLAKEILDEEIKVFVLSGMAVFVDKVISKENANIIRRLLTMTKVGQLFEEEKIEYAKEYAKEQILLKIVSMYQLGILSVEAAAGQLNMTEDEFLAKVKNVK